MVDSIKVLSICTSDSSGGAARAAYRIHQAVKTIGIDSRMFVKQKNTDDPDVIPLQVFIPGNPFYKAFDWVRNKIKNKWQHLIWGRYPNRSSYFMSDLRSTDINGALQKLDYDILHLHWINLRFLPLDELPKDKPIVWTLHDSWPFCGVCHLPYDCKGYVRECGHCPSLQSENGDDLSHRVWRKKNSLYSKLDLHIVTPSQWLADCAKKSSLFRKYDIRVIPNCIDTNTFAPDNKADACSILHLNPEKNYLLFGAMNAVKDENKGFRFLIEALSSIQSSLPAYTELIVFGSEDSIEHEISGIRAINLGMLRDYNKIVAAYQSSSISIVPSLSENLSNTIMESLSCGTPVIAFNIGGNGDMIDHQQNGYLAREMDSQDLAQGILWCLENNKDGNLSQNARQKVLDNFTPEVVGEKYANLYKSILN